MTKFEALLAVHLLAAVTWVGGNVYFHLLWVRAEKSTDVSNLGFLGQNAEWIGNRFFIPSSLLLLVTGILMVEDIEGCCPSSSAPVSLAPGREARPDAPDRRAH